MGKGKQKDFNLKDSFVAFQESLEANLGLSRRSTTHPGAKGTATEFGWLEMLKGHLPRRYCVEKGFVVDSDGAVSDEIDIIVFDQHYSPFLLKHQGIIHVPAESVYAALEIKPTLNKSNLLYAGKKIASVRRLRRTSVPIRHAGGKFSAVTPPDILGAFLCLNSAWTSFRGNGASNAFHALKGEHRIELGCVLEQGAFEVRYPSIFEMEIRTSPRKVGLISFFLKLLARLQAAGTVAAMDIDAYSRYLGKWDSIECEEKGHRKRKASSHA